MAWKGQYPSLCQKCFERLGLKAGHGRPISGFYVNVNGFVKSLAMYGKAAEHNIEVMRL